MATSLNVTSMIIQRESCHRGTVNRGILSAAEDKAASCEMDELSCKIPENTRSTFLFTFSPDGTKVASAHGNHKIYVCDIGSGKCLHTLEGHPRTPWCITFHPNYEGVLASGCLGGEVRVWDLHGGCEVWVGMKNSAICSLTFHPFDQVLVIATTNAIYFWDWSQAQPFASCKTSCDKEKVRFVEFDSYGHRLFTGIANVTPVYRHRELTSSYAIDQENSGIDRFSLLLESQHGRGRSQSLHFSNLAEEGANEAVESSLPPLFSENLRLAREYAASQTASSVVTENDSRPYDEFSNSSNSTLSSERLLELILEFRSSIINICELLQSFVLQRHSELCLANYVFRFWRVINTGFSIMRQFSHQIDFEFPPAYLEDRSRMIEYLFHHQERMQFRSFNDSSIMNPAAGQVMRRHRRLQYIYNILAKLLELVSLDYNMLIRSVSLSEESSHRVNGSFSHPIEPIVTNAVSELRGMAAQHGLIITGGSGSYFPGQTTIGNLELRNIEESVDQIRNVSSTSRESPGTSRLSNLQLNDDTINDEINTEQVLDKIFEEFFISWSVLFGERSNVGRSLVSNVGRPQPHSSAYFVYDSNHHSRASSNSLQSNFHRSSPFVTSYLGSSSRSHRSYNSVPEPVFVTRAHYRIQCWDFTKFIIPDISNAHANVVVAECLIQNDASIELSTDDQLLATLVPSNSPTANILAIYSIRPNTFGQCLYMWNFVSSVISISLSPLGRYVLVGLGSNRRSLDNNGGKLVIGQVLKLIESNDETRECVQHVRTVELRGENRFDVSLNSMRWLPYSGHGLVYGTNRGDLRICRPKSFNELGIRPPSSQWIGHDLARAFQWRNRFRRPSSFMLHHSILENLPNASSSVPSTSSTGTQTETVNH